MKNKTIKMIIKTLALVGLNTVIKSAYEEEKYEM